MATPPDSQQRGFESAATFVRKIGRRLVKGTLLVFWILALLSLAVESWRGEGTRTIENLLPGIGQSVSIRGLSLTSDGEIDFSPIALLERYQNRRYSENPPPLDVTLSALISDPDWTDYERFVRDPETGEPDVSKKQATEEYNRLFRRTADALRAIVDDTSVPPSAQWLSADVVPAFFQDIAADNDDVPLPGDAVAWVERERARLAELEQRDQLANTFILLVVLGAFGSLIFLSRDFIVSADREATTPIAAYVFRPVLGMLLAMAMFVIDILVQAVVSTADMVDIRREPLYLVAFAAGLLSEQAYGIVHERAQQALERYREDRADRT